jgi:hypothetical protein
VANFSFPLNLVEQRIEKDEPQRTQRTQRKK